MNTELMLKLQSWVDGELPASEAARVAELVRTDKEAAALAVELRTTRGFLAGNEPEAKLAESREFYWSKIERGIERAEAEAAASARGAWPWLAALRRFLVPASGFALVAFITLFSIGVFNRDSGTGPAAGEGRLHPLVEEQTLSEHVDTISYRTKSENMFVVYIVNKDEAADDDDMDASEEMDDAVIQ
jgi:anti-sigma factor RsiW